MPRVTRSELMKLMRGRKTSVPVQGLDVTVKVSQDDAEFVRSLSDGEVCVEHDDDDVYVTPNVDHAYGESGVFKIGTY